MLVAIKVAFAVIAALGAGFHLAAPMSQPSVSAPSGALFAAGSPLVPGRAVDRSFDVSTSGATYLGLYMTGLQTSCPNAGGWGGQFDGGQGEAVRVPFADATLVKIDRDAASDDGLLTRLLPLTSFP